LSAGSTWEVEWDVHLTLLKAALTDVILWELYYNYDRVGYTIVLYVLLLLFLWPVLLKFFKY